MDTWTVLLGYSWHLINEGSTGGEDGTNSALNGLGVVLAETFTGLMPNKCLEGPCRPRLLHQEAPLEGCLVIPCTGVNTVPPNSCPP